MHEVHNGCGPSNLAATCYSLLTVSGGSRELADEDRIVLLVSYLFFITTLFREVRTSKIDYLLHRSHSNLSNSITQ